MSPAGRGTSVEAENIDILTELLLHSARSVLHRAKVRHICFEREDIAFWQLERFDSFIEAGLVVVYQRQPHAMRCECCAQRSANAASSCSVISARHKVETTLEELEETVPAPVITATPRFLIAGCMADTICE